MAVRKDIGQIRILDQVKRHKPGHVVTPEEVCYAAQSKSSGIVQIISIAI
jgi:hypothetical protein